MPKLPCPKLGEISVNPIGFTYVSKVKDVTIKSAPISPRENRHHHDSTVST
jgi:hypothetical protein